MNDTPLPNNPDGSVFGPGSEFIDVELAALRSEVNRLTAELASRTEAWRVALRELSEAQVELGTLKGEIESTTRASLSSADWFQIQNRDTGRAKPGS